MKGEKESSGEIRLRDERGDGLERKREGKKRDEDMSGLEQKANADEETTDHPSNKMEHDKNSEISSTPSSSLKKPRSSPNFYTHCRAGSNNGKGKQMMTYDHQRAMPKCRRPMITGRKRVSVIIEEGGECYGGGCGVFDSGWRCGRERGRKVWEELWGRLRGL
ncbi:uncharacterized protein EAF01_006947 [Botrytis porri]|uniref:uncharacterized protein n=1 Tax=Botrytis porri TaxID=87229 RepID=UPI0019026499|nr:uncharacterized protein EAF01_006947 [Botrytis porri]KAF7901648.1 hypothetical protein EAF01_006947 [Botrytis porri]